MKRSVVLSIFSLVLALLLQACGGDGGSPTRVQPPTITVQPVSASALVGTGVSFSVTASGDSLSFQWQSSTDQGVTWVAVSGAVAATYTIAMVDATMNGNEYRVVVSGPTTSVTSSAVTLIATAAATPPGISVQPANQSTVEGADATFSVTATGTALNYQWQSSPDASTWTDIGGATGATLTLIAVPLANSGESLRVIVSNSAGSVPSSPAELTVTAVPGPPIIVQAPLAASVVAPQAASFSVVATGTPAPSYQWQKSSDGGATYVDISGATSTTYTTPATSTSDSGTLFRVHLVNSAGDVFSVSVQLTVSPAPAPPVITLQPVGQSVTAPAAATFSVTATGTPTPTYQWQVSTDGGSTFSNVNGATASTYITPATATTDTGHWFRVIVSNASGTVTSTAVTVTVSSAAQTTQFVYAAGGNAITGYAIDLASGLVTATPGSPYSTISNVSTMYRHPSGRWLYATTVNNTGGIAVYSIDSQTGRLTPVIGSPFALGTVTTEAALHPSGNFIYLSGGASGIAAFRIDPTAGTLSSVAGSPFLLGSTYAYSHLVIDPTGKFAFMKGVSNSFHSLVIDGATGALSEAAGSPMNLAPLLDPIVDPSGNYLLLQTSTTDIQSFAINRTSGALSPLPGFSAPGFLINNFTLHPNGKCLYAGEVSNNNSSQPSLQALTMDPATGAIAQAAGSLQNVGTSTWLTVNPVATFGYIAGNANPLSTNFVTAVNIDAVSCGLTEIAGNFNPSLHVNAFDANGKFAFGGANSSTGLLIFDLDPITHVPIQKAGSPFTTTSPVGFILAP